MNERMTPDAADDDLIRLYHQAADLDGQAPSAAVGEAVRAHARMQDAARRPGAASAAVRAVADTADKAGKADTAANARRWRLSMVASVTVLGLAGLLVVQFDRGTPQEQQLAGGPALAPPAADAAPAAPAAAKALPPVAPDAAKALPPVAPRPAAEMQARLKAAAPVGAPAAAPPETAALGVARSRPGPAPSARDDGGQVAAAARAEATESVAQADTVAGLSAARVQRTPAGSSLHRLAATGAWAELADRLAAGAPVDARDAQGRTPLMVAAQAGQAEVVRQLLRAGARPQLVDRAGRTAAQWAQLSGRDDIVRLLADAPAAGSDGR